MIFSLRRRRRKGEGGIRTHGACLERACFQDKSNNPLCHFSVMSLGGFEPHTVKILSLMPLPLGYRLVYGDPCRIRTGTLFKAADFLTTIAFATTHTLIVDILPTTKAGGFLDSNRDCLTEAKSDIP